MIGKSRHAETLATPAQILNPQDIVGQGCGVLRHSPPPGTYEHLRYVPPQDLAPWIEHFWIERWHIDSDVPQVRELLPHPAVHLVFAPGRTRVYGVQLRRFVRELKGTCCILGAKFHSGAFFPFFRRPVGSLADRFVPADDVFAGASIAEAGILQAGDDAAMVAAAVAFVRASLPAPDIKVEVARQAVHEIAQDPELTRVGELIERIGSTERAVQRLFFGYVGASPRWVIKRYRTFEALERLADLRGVGLSDLAQDLGYFDQAHFTNDFRKLTGLAPAKYTGIGSDQAGGRHANISQRR